MIEKRLLGKAARARVGEFSIWKIVQSLLISWLFPMMRSPLQRIEKEGDIYGSV
jgi:hypothetical protein